MKYQLRSIAGYGMILLVILSICSCVGSTRPQRKKMPELNGFQDLDDGGYQGNGISDGLSLVAGNLKLETADGMRNFVSVPLPNASADTLLLEWLSTLKPLALPLLNNWVRNQNSGVLLDLSCHQRGEATFQASYMLKQAGGFSIPVIIRWDDGSGYRAKLAEGLVQGVPSLSLNKISGDNLSNGSDR